MESVKQPKIELEVEGVWILLKTSKSKTLNPFFRGSTHLVDEWRKPLDSR